VGAEDSRVRLQTCPVRGDDKMEAGERGETRDKVGHQKARGSFCQGFGVLMLGEGQPRSEEKEDRGSITSTVGLQAEPPAGGGTQKE